MQYSVVVRLARMWVEGNENEDDYWADDGGGEEQAKQTSIDDDGHLSPLGHDVRPTSSRLHHRRDHAHLPQYLPRRRQSLGAGAVAASDAVLRAGRVRRIVDVLTRCGGQHVAVARSHVGRRQRNVVG